MRIDELLKSAQRRRFAAMPETDALTEEDGLQEACLLDVHYALKESRLAMLFDLRQALQFRMPEVGVLVIRGVRRAEFTRTGQPGIRFAPAVMGSIPTARDGLFSFELICLGGSRVSAVGTSAEFFVGDIPGLPPAQPNFGEDDDRRGHAGLELPLHSRLGDLPRQGGHSRMIRRHHEAK